VTFSLELPRELESAAAARHGVDQLADTLGEEQLGDVRLLVSELVTNALRHAELAPEDSITLNVKVDDAMVRVEVADPGTGFDLAGRAEDPETVEGWGLYLVATLSDRWGVERSAAGVANVVWFELDRTSSLDAAA
jgi:anti-sigma regulatory factor (Ser/Thr protein kinase)